jgi:hypothetical protein
MRRALGHLGAAAAVLSAAALLVECTARVHLFGLAGLHPLRVDSVRPIFQTDLLQASSVPEIAFELRPGLDVWFKLVRLRTNSRGLRYREIEPAKPPGAFRVAVLGSSFTLPAGVELEDAFHARLERYFNGGAEKRFEFVNFAQGVFHPAQNVAVLEHRALAYDPDLALFCLTSMGARAAFAERRARTILPEDPTHPFFGSFLRQLVQLRTGTPPRSEVRLAAREDDARVPSVIERLGVFTAHTKIPVVVVRLEFGGDPESVIDGRLRREVLERGMGYVDTRAIFRGVDRRSLWIYELDPHPNATAHAGFAEVISDYLVASGYIPPP